MASTDDVIAQLIAYWGFSCPKGGSFYICPDMEQEFLGCCSVDPCTKERNGVCPDDNLRPGSFSSDKWGLLPAQGCSVSKEEAVFFTCRDATPTFIGCCATGNIPCNAGCPQDKLRQSVLNNLPFEGESRRYLLNPNGSGISYDRAKAAANGTASTSSSTTQPTSSSTTQPDPNGSGGLSTGAIAGIAVGAVLAGLIIVAAIMWKCGWFPRKKKEEEIKQEVDVPGAAMSHMSPMTPMAQQAYPHQGHQGYGYADETGRSVMSSPSTGYIRGKRKPSTLFFSTIHRSNPLILSPSICRLLREQRHCSRQPVWCFSGPFQGWPLQPTRVSGS